MKSAAVESKCVNYVNSVLYSASLWIRDFEIPAFLLNPAANLLVFVFIDFLPVFVLLRLSF